MFEGFFGLSATAFARDIAPEAVFLTASHREGLARLRYTSERRQMMLLTGERGVGKSTLLRRFKADLDPTRFEVLALCQTGATVKSFLHELLWQLRVEPPYAITRTKLLAARTLLARYQNRSRTVVLLVDEAEHLSEAVLEELRGLATGEFDAFSPFALVLCGQPALARRLGMAHLQTLADRIVLRHQLAAFTEEQTLAYIAHQLQLAGATREIFTQAAMQRIHQACSGLARPINMLAIHCLISAASTQTPLIDDHLVDEMIHCESLEVSPMQGPN